MTETTRSLIKTPDLDLRAAMRDPFVIVPQVLDLVRLNGAIFFRSHFRSPWAYTSPPVLELASALPPAPGSLVLFHIVAEGNPQPGVASFPLRRQMVAVVTVDGAVKASGRSRFVAVFMKRAQSGTASSAA